MVSHQAVNSLNISTSVLLKTDGIHKVDISVEWCPTGEMNGHILTKPNQVLIFKRDRDLITGVMPQKYPSSVKQVEKK